MNRAHMKTPFILTCACAAALVFPLSSCSTQNSSTAGYDTAEPASGDASPPAPPAAKSRRGLRKVLIPLTNPAITARFRVLPATLTIPPPSLPSLKNHPRGRARPAANPPAARLPERAPPVNPLPRPAPTP